jgi:hypothetical protein
MKSRRAIAEGDDLRSQICEYAKDVVVRFSTIIVLVARIAELPLL